MKKILQIINYSQSAENFIGEQFSFFPRNGDYEMHLICSDGPNLEQFVKKHSIKCKVVPINRNITPWQDLRSLIAICRYIRINKIDVIICHQEKANLLGQTAGFFMRVPVRIVLSHGILYESMAGVKRFLIRIQDRLVSSMATNVICVSKFVKEKRTEDKVDRPGKAVVLGHGSCNGIDTKNRYNPQLVTNEELNSLRVKYGFKEDDFVVGFCGRLVKDKGVVELTEAFEQLMERHTEKKIKLLIVGDFEQRDALPKETQMYLNEYEKIIMTGYVKHEDIAKYYQLMSVLVLPSHRDGLGLAPLEAQAMEVPAIVSRTTGCKETIIEHETGEYVDLNSQSIADKLELFMDEEFSKRLGKKGRLFVQECFDTKIVYNNMIDYINELTKEI